MEISRIPQKKSSNRTFFFIFLSIFIGGIIVAMILIDPLQNFNTTPPKDKDYNSEDILYHPENYYYNISLSIDYWNGTIETNSNLTISKSNSSVFDILSQNYEVSYKTYSLGKLVTGINGLIENQENNTYWFIWINGTYSNNGAEQIYVKNNTLVEWKYREWNPSLFS
ncbi:MAG: DUF4430 domain-containing protein [Promethearchaeota archaeon]